MKNFTTFSLIAFVLCACNKETELPNNNRPVPPPSPPPIAVPVTTASISINGTSMNIASLSYQRRNSGAGGGIFITATNHLQKVTAVASPFYQYSPGNMMYVMEVSYFTRADSLSDWGVTYPRPVPRDDRIYFDNSAPLSDKEVKGNFSASFIGANGSTKDEVRIVLTGYFVLVF